MSEKKQTVVITGASRGIGLALVGTYLARDCEVIAVCRKPSQALMALGAEVIDGVDVSDAKAVAHLAETLRGKSIDILINNAGVLHSESLGNIEYDHVLHQLEVNALGPLRVTEALLSQLSSGASGASSAKVAMITSRMGSISDNGSGGYYGYRMSKAALNAAAMSLSKDLQPKGIAVAILHPDLCKPTW